MSSPWNGRWPTPPSSPASWRRRIGSPPPRGTPAVELTAGDGSALVIARQDHLAALMWSDPDGHTHHSVGDPDSDGCLVADYLGSYTEIPEEFAVAVDLAHAAAAAYVESGHPTAPGLTLELD